MGEEYTVNLFFDRAGVLRCAIPHLRREIRARRGRQGHHPAPPTRSSRSPGTSVRRSQARAARLCFQAIVDAAGEPRVFEINGRFGGGYPLAHAGRRRVRALAARGDPRPPPAAPATTGRSGIVMLRYDQAVFRREAGAPR